MTEETVLRARVTGRVQGVWFRGWTQDQARQLGLRGWVRNEPDGSVTTLIAGPGAAVDDMLAALHQGPEAARVWEVVTEEVSEAVPEGFAIVG